MKLTSKWTLANMVKRRTKMCFYFSISTARNKTIRKKKAKKEIANSLTIMH